MRIWSLSCLLCAISLAGCGPEPVAQRAEPLTSTEPKSADKPATSAEREKPADQPADKPADEPAAAGETDGKLRLDRLVLTVPEGWRRKQAASNFILAEFVLPKAEGDDTDGRLTVSVAGGTVEANIDRWRDQFGGKPEKSSEEKKKVGDLEITVVDFTGEFNDQRGPFAPAVKRANHRMLAAVIPVDGELHFIKATGPQATIAAHAERFQEFLNSVQPKK